MAHLSVLSEDTFFLAAPHLLVGLLGTCVCWPITDELCQAPQSGHPGLIQTDSICLPQCLASCRNQTCQDTFSSCVYPGWSLTHHHPPFIWTTGSVLCNFTRLWAEFTVGKLEMVQVQFFFFPTDLIYYDHSQGQKDELLRNSVTKCQGSMSSIDLTFPDTVYWMDKYILWHTVTSQNTFLTRNSCRVSNYWAFNATQQNLFFTKGWHLNSVCQFTREWRTWFKSYKCTMEQLC